MTKGQRVSIKTKRGIQVSGIVRGSFSTFVIINDERFRPKVVLKKEIEEVIYE